MKRNHKLHRIKEKRVLYPFLSELTVKCSYQRTLRTRRDENDGHVNLTAVHNTTGRGCALLGFIMPIENHELYDLFVEGVLFDDAAHGQRWIRISKRA